MAYSVSDGESVGQPNSLITLKFSLLPLTFWSIFAMLCAVCTALFYLLMFCFYSCKEDILLVLRDQPMLIHHHIPYGSLSFHG